MSTFINVQDVRIPNKCIVDDYSASELAKQRYLEFDDDKIKVNRFSIDGSLAVMMAAGQAYIDDVPWYTDSYLTDVIIYANRVYFSELMRSQA